jgi:hypothetical protein
MCVYCATECAFYYLHEHSSCTCMHKCTYSVCRVGQSRIYTPYMTVCLVVSLPKRPCIHCTYMIYGFGQPWVRAEMCAFYAFCLSLCFLHFVPSLCFLHVLFVTVLSTRSVCHCAFYTFCLSLCFLHVLFVTVLSARSVCHCAFYTFCLSLCFPHVLFVTVLSNSDLSLCFPHFLFVTVLSTLSVCHCAFYTCLHARTCCTVWLWLAATLRGMGTHSLAHHQTVCAPAPNNA